MTVPAFLQYEADKDYIVQFYLPSGNYRLQDGTSYVSYNIHSPILEERHWSKEIKYMNPENTEVSNEIKQIPNKSGGLYVFYLKGSGLPFMERYILYIGRVQYTKGMNIRKRALEYYKEYKKNKNSRLGIRYMFEHWSKHLYYRYYTDVDNPSIVALEESLIKTLLPPFNTDIPNKQKPKTNVAAFKL
ncbi:MAG: hypothetical protein MJZ27_06545 [Bacteroidales bacterium]|nr:hypothetical protein [Bacteroidales bacterium]